MHDRPTSTHAFASMLLSLVAATSILFGVSALTKVARSMQPLDRWPLQKLTTISLPGTSASNWCYDTAVTNNGTYYLADNDRAGIDVIRDTNHPNYRGILGKGQFTGIGGCKSGNYDSDGPNGLAISGDQIFAGDGNSSVRVYSSKTGRFIKHIATGGYQRADEMTYDARDHVVVVANGSERASSKKHAPFLSFISTQPGKSYDQIVKTLFFPHADALEQPMWNPIDGKLYLTVPSSDQNPTGEVDVIDPTTLKITHIATPNCEDAGLAFANRNLAAVGCASGEQIILNVYTHHIIRVPVTAVDIVAADNQFLYFASYGSNTQAPQLAVTDLVGHLLQEIPISRASHTVTVDNATGHVCVPLDGGHIAIFQESRHFSDDTQFPFGKMALPSSESRSSFDQSK